MNLADSGEADSDNRETHLNLTVWEMWIMTPFDSDSASESGEYISRPLAWNPQLVHRRNFEQHSQKQSRARIKTCARTIGPDSKQRFATLQFVESVYNLGIGQSGNLATDSQNHYQEPSQWSTIFGIRKKNNVIRNPENPWDLLPNAIPAPSPERPPDEAGGELHLFSVPKTNSAQEFC